MSPRAFGSDWAQLESNMFGTCAGLSNDCRQLKPTIVNAIHLRNVMPQPTAHSPRAVPQVMVSSTFLDLQEHRAAMIQAIHKHKLHANVMEHDDAKPSHDVIDSSLQMVRDSAVVQRRANPHLGRRQLKMADLAQRGIIA